MFFPDFVNPDETFSSGPDIVLLIRYQKKWIFEGILIGYWIKIESM
jgi:hypothetical protein